MSHRVGLVVFDGVRLLDVSGPAEVLHQARSQGCAYEVVLVSPHGGGVMTSTGMPLSGTVRAAEAGGVDTVLVAGGDHLVQGVEEELAATTRALVEGAGRVASVCTGAFVLAGLGLLEGRGATTHWRHAGALARRYPGVRVRPDAIHVRDGCFITSAGVSAGIDLALALVEEDHGARVARGVAQELVVYLRRPGGQSQFGGQVPVSVGEGPLRRVVEAVRADPRAEHDLPSMARVAAVSPRHLSRLFHAELGTTPARWVERVRLDLAQRFLLEGSGVTSAARRSGFGSDETLRRVFVRHLGSTPTEFRRRFATTDVGMDATGSGS